MLSNSYELTRAQQKKLKNQAKRRSWMTLKQWTGFLNEAQHRMARFTGTFKALQQEDSSFQGETRLQNNGRFMDLR